MPIARNPDEALVRLRAGGAGRFALVRRAIDRWLRRPFPNGAKHRILLVFQNNRLAWPQFYPLLRDRERYAGLGVAFRAVPFPGAHRPALLRTATAIFVQGRHSPEKGENGAALAALRAVNGTAPISFFDWSAPTDARGAPEVAPWASAYVKKSLSRDLGDYRRLPRGHTHLEDWYAEANGIPDVPPDWPAQDEIVDRLVAGPAFVTSMELLPLFEARAAPPAGDRPIDVQARIATRGSPWYTAMREHSLAAARALAKTRRVAFEGRLSRAAYMAELGRSKICFSPFGYGEICWRDSEAILAGAVLVKQDMAHVESVPDIYRPNETYVPVRWDLADLADVIDGLLADPARCRAIAERAYAVVRDYLDGPSLEAMTLRLATLPARG